jgi:hypothetical protein
MIEGCAVIDSCAIIECCVVEFIKTFSVFVGLTAIEDCAVLFSS